MDSIERWLPVVDYEGSYEVSDHGRVRSLDRVIEQIGPTGRRFQSFRKGRMLALCPHSAGYHQVWVRNAAVPGQRRRKAFVHILVARAFIGEPPRADLEVCHGDGDPTNNHVANLRWDTVSNNKFDAVKHGTHGETQKTRCPYGHRLVAPNLRPVAAGQRPSRRCLSCKRGATRAAGRSGLNRRVEADRFYASLGLGAPEKFGDGVDERASA